jgi:hypothetical protein
MTNSRYTKTLLAAVGTGGLIAAGLLHPGLAHADEDSYQSHLEQSGLPSGQDALAVGHGICLDVTKHGLAGVRTQTEIGLKVGFTPDEVSTVIRYALQDLCPSQVSVLQTQYE